MAKDEKTPDAASAADSGPAPVKPSSNSSNSQGNIVKRNQTDTVIELQISATKRTLRIEPFGLVTLSDAEWNSPELKKYQKILQ